MLARELERAITSTLSAIDVYALDAKEQKAINELKHGLVDARLDIQDYELSETRDMQLEAKKESSDRLDGLHKYIILLGEYNIISSVDVAMFSAQLEHIKSLLR